MDSLASGRVTDGDRVTGQRAGWKCSRGLKKSGPMSYEESSSAVKAARARLEPHDKTALLRPFSRAKRLADVALYWLPVSAYPLPSRERLWVLTFLRQLKSVLTTQKQLRMESFLQFKTIYPDLQNLFLNKCQEYHPMIGLQLAPGAKLPPAPDAKQIEDEIKKGGSVDVKQWMADYCYWFVAKKDEPQLQDFFGCGGMTLLFLKPDSNTQPPNLKIPKIMRTHPAFKGPELESARAIAYSLQDKFLNQSKEVFGELIRDDCSYRGIPFILPLLKSPDFFRATPDQRARWFEVFDVYCTESKEDKGILLALKDAEFDDSLIDIVKQLKDQGMAYPL
jgi:hypothetical protein